MLFLIIDLRAISGKAERIHQNVDDAVHAKHNQESDNPPHDMILAFFALFGIFRVSNELKHSVEEDHRRDDERELYRGVYDILINLSEKGIKSVSMRDK